VRLQKARADDLAVRCANLESLLERLRVTLGGAAAPSPCVAHPLHGAAVQPLPAALSRPVGAAFAAGKGGHTAAEVVAASSGGRKRARSPSPQLLPTDEELPRPLSPLRPPYAWPPRELRPSAQDAPLPGSPQAERPAAAKAAAKPPVKAAGVKRIATKPAGPKPKTRAKSPEKLQAPAEDMAVVVGRAAAVPLGKGQAPPELRGKFAAAEAAGAAATGQAGVCSCLREAAAGGDACVAACARGLAAAASTRAVAPTDLLAGAVSTLAQPPVPALAGGIMALDAELSRGAGRVRLLGDGVRGAFASLVAAAACQAAREACSTRSALVLPSHAAGGAAAMLAARGGRTSRASAAALALDLMLLGVPAAAAAVFIVWPNLLACGSADPLAAALAAVMLDALSDATRSKLSLPPALEDISVDQAAAMCIDALSREDAHAGARGLEVLASHLGWPWARDQVLAKHLLPAIQPRQPIRMMCGALRAVAPLLLTSRGAADEASAAGAEALVALLKPGMPRAAAWAAAEALLELDGRQAGGAGQERAAVIAWWQGSRDQLLRDEAPRRLRLALASVGLT
jgi:hypothetical protein